MQLHRSFHSSFHLERRPVARQNLRFNNPCIRSSASIADSLGDPADNIPSAYDDEDEEGRQDPASQNVLVAGAGPSGLLTSLYLARRGYHVTVIDKKTHGCQGHNHPMVLSSRALIAFRELKLKDISFYNGSNARPFLGEIALSGHNVTIPSTSSSVVPDLDQPESRSLVDYHRLIEELESQVKETQKIKINRGVELTKVDLLQNKAKLLDLGSREETEISFDLIVGADGSDSLVRRTMTKTKKGNLDETFEAQEHSTDKRTYKSFKGLSLDGTLAPFNSSSVGSHLFTLSPSKPKNGPSFEFWINSSHPDTVDGILIAPPGFRYNKDELTSYLSSSDAYPWPLPDSWVGGLIDQICGPHSKEPRVLGRNIQSSQFHGPSSILMGDAAHSLTTESRQGMNLSVESVRLFNSVLKVSGSLKRSGEVFTEVRREDAHSIHTIEGMMRATKSIDDMEFKDWGHQLAASLGVLVYAAARYGCSLLGNVFPQRFKVDWVQGALDNCRKGYSDGILKIVTRFAALPILLAIVFATIFFWQPLTSMLKA